MFNYFNKQKTNNAFAVDQGFITRVSNIAIEFLQDHGFSGIEFSHDAPNNLKDLKQMYNFRKAEKNAILGLY